MMEARNENNIREHAVTIDTTHINTNTHEHENEVLPSPPALTIAPATDEGIEDPPAAGSFPWAPPPPVEPKVTIHLQPSNGGVGVVIVGGGGGVSSIGGGGGLPSEYSSSNKKNGGSQSFHQDSFHHPADMLEAESVGPGIGLMDPAAMNAKPIQTTLPQALSPGIASGVASALQPASSLTPIKSAAPTPMIPKSMGSTRTLLANTKEEESTPGSTSAPEPEPDFYAQPDNSQTKKSWLSRLRCPASCGGYNIVKVFVILSACQVLVACILVWVVGYMGLLDAADKLSGQVRDAIMSGVVTDIDNRFAVTVSAVNNLHYMTRARFSNIDTLTDIMSIDGYLADLFHLILRYPDTGRIGFLNAAGLYVTVQKLNGAETYSSSEGMYVSISEPSTGNLYTFQPQPLPSRSIIPNRPPLTLTPEIFPTDSASFINSYLGSPVRVETDFTIESVRYLPFMLTSINNSAVRAADPTRSQLATGWTAPFSAQDQVTFDNTQGFLSISTFVPVINPETGDLLMSSFIYFKLVDLEKSMQSMPFGSRGKLHIIRAGGDILASTDPSIQAQIVESQQAVQIENADDSMILKIHDFLLEWGLITDVATNTSISVPYTAEQFSRSFHHDGRGWRLEARMLDRTVSALPYTVLLITADDDFDGGVGDLIRTTALVAAAIGVVAVMLTFAITRCITRPLLSVVDYMGKAVSVISMDRGPTQREALAQLCESWSADSGMVMPPLLSSNQHAALTKQDPFQGQPIYASFCWLCNDRGDTCCCFRVGRSLREVQQMHAAYGSLLYTLASYDELEAINQAKRQFIRYIFHEVRVPFNAIVMGIEQMQMDLAPHQLTFSNTLETLDILREQSSVVSRILNDVLSMQKIEDGALALEYDNFSLDKMIRGALYAFRTPCLEKRLKVRVNLHSLDQLVGESLPGLRLGKTRSRISKGSNTSGAKHSAIKPANDSFGSDTIGNGAAPRGGGGGNTGAATLNPNNLNNSTLGEHSANQQGEVYHAQVRGDPYRLRQCLANFVSNAIKFTPIGGLIRVSLEVSRFEVNPLASIASDQLMVAMGLDPKHPSESRRGGGGGSSWHQPLPPAPQLNDPDSPEKVRPIVPELLGTVMVRVAVKDSGQGIPLEHQKHIFEAYHQVQAGKIQKGDGTGLGLNITRSIVELHGGQISYTSVPGEGAEFFFALPMDVMLVRTGSKGDSSSYGAASRTPAQSSQVSDRKLETIAGSPEQMLRELGPSPPDHSTIESYAGAANTTPYAGGSTTTIGASTLTNQLVSARSQSHSTTNLPSISYPHDIELTTLQGNRPTGSTTNTPATHLSPLDNVQHAIDEHANGQGTPRFHDDHGDGEAGVSSTRPPLSASDSSSPPAASATLPPMHQSRPAGAGRPPALDRLSSVDRTTDRQLHHSVERSDRNSTNSASGVSSAGESDDAFYGSSTNRDRRRMRATNLGVAIPSLAANITHAPAQNLTASVKAATPPQTAAITNTNNTATTTNPTPTTVAASVPVTVTPPTIPSNGATTGVVVPSSAVASSATPHVPAPARSSSASGGATFQGMRVLVVEDSHPNRKLLMSLLTHMGCQATGVENGQLCVDTFKAFMTSPPSLKTQYTGPTHTATTGGATEAAQPASTSTSDTMAQHHHNEPYPIDLILMDGSMPVLNGVEATQILRQHGVMVPIIAVTGNALAEDQAAFLAAGAQGVLTKPIRKQLLIQVLNQYRPNRMASAASFSQSSPQPPPPPPTPPHIPTPTHATLPPLPPRHTHTSHATAQHAGHDGADDEAQERILHMA